MERKFLMKSYLKIMRLMILAAKSLFNWREEVTTEAVCLCVHVYYIFKLSSSLTALENKLFLMNSIKPCPDRQQRRFTEIYKKSLKID